MLECRSCLFQSRPFSSRVLPAACLVSFIPTYGHLGKRLFARVIIYMLLGWIVVGVCIKMSESFALVPAGRSFFLETGASVLVGFFIFPARAGFVAIWCAQYFMLFNASIEVNHLGNSAEVPRWFSHCKYNTWQNLYFRHD